jgi:hypothetical protein
VACLEADEPFMHRLLRVPMPLIKNENADSVLSNVDGRMAPSVEMVAVMAARIERGNHGAWLQLSVAFDLRALVPQRRWRGRDDGMDERDALAVSDKFPLQGIRHAPFVTIKHQPLALEWQDYGRRRVVVLVGEASQIREIRIKFLKRARQ